MTRILQMIFNNTAGRSSTISVHDPKDALGTAEVEGVMQLVVDRNIFQTAGGEIVSAREARLVTRDVETIVSF